MAINKNRLTSCVLLALSAALAPSSSIAQPDPRAPLGILIEGFQKCTLQHITFMYYYLGKQVYESVAEQTKGTGCYRDLQPLGPVSDLTVITSRPFPQGPVFSIRATHNSGAVTDWQLGLNNNTEKVDGLRWSIVRGIDKSTGEDKRKDDRTGVDKPTGRDKRKDDRKVGGKPPRVETPEPEKLPAADGDGGCKLYPAMCE